jgi:hypothetical protein
VFPIAAVLAGLFFLGHSILHRSVGCLVIVIEAAPLLTAIEEVEAEHESQLVLAK